MVFVAAFLFSLALGLYLTPLMREAALRFGVVDHPDGSLKKHAKVTPYLGGVAVYLAFLTTLSLVFEFHLHLLGLLLGGTMMAMMGLFDDLKVLPASFKLLGQALVAWVVIKSDISIQLVALPEIWRLPLSVVWLLVVSNSINIIDVSDGLAGLVSAIAASGLLVVALINGDDVIASASVALIGALLGFLWFNRAPAQIFLGDTGSLFIGFMLAALAMIGAYTTTGLVGAMAPLFVLVVPLLDVALVSVARLSRGVSPLRGSGDHFAIRLKRRGWSANRVALAAALLGAVGSACGVAVVVLSQDLAIVVAVIFSSLTFVALLLLLRLRSA